MINLAEKMVFAAGAWHRRGEFRVRKRAEYRKNCSDDPRSENYADALSFARHLRRLQKNSRADHCADNDRCRSPWTQVADQFEDWYHGRAADGFNVVNPVQPRSLRDFVDLVIPELQRRKLFRTEYPGGTLRNMLGLPTPRRQINPNGAWAFTKPA